MKNLTHEGFALPPDTCTRTLAILGQKGSGKTHTALVITEGLTDDNQQVVCLDPTGVWWGLRANREGQPSQRNIIIMGGEHGDVPLEDTAGVIVANFIVESGSSVVLDLSHFPSKAAQNRFVTALAERLYRLKGAVQYRTPLHLMLDEADQFCPQRPMAGEQAMLGAFETIVRLGRSRGMGMTLISQRPAVVNKNVLTQADAVFCHRIVGKQDIDAVLAWVRHFNASQMDAQKFAATLVTLATGEMWLWSPSWLNVMNRDHVVASESYDSSRTPVSSAGRPDAPRPVLGGVDLVALTSQIKESVEHVKQTDVKHLTARVKELEAELAGRVVPTVEVNPISAEDRIYLGALRLTFEAVLQAVHAIDAPRLQKLLTKVSAADQDPAMVVKPTAAATPTAQRVTSDASLSKCERAILTVLAQVGAPCLRAKIALWSGYSAGSGSFRNALSGLRTRGFIADIDLLSMTEAGQQALGPIQSLPTGVDFIRYWITELPKCPASILSALLEAPDHTLTQREIGDAAGYSFMSGSFKNALSELRTRELIIGRDPVTLIIPTPHERD